MRASSKSKVQDRRRSRYLDYTTTTADELESCKKNIAVKFGWNNYCSRSEVKVAIANILDFIEGSMKEF